MSRLSFGTALTVVATLSLSAAFAAPPEAKVKGPEAFKQRGEIVDCTEYLLTGQHGEARLQFQAQAIDAGRPACFISSEDGEVYLLVQYGGDARSQFQPTTTFMGGDVQLDGVVYQRGALKALSINSIARTGAFTDRESRRSDNPTPTRLTDTKDPKKSPYVPSVPKPAEPVPAGAPK